MYAQFREREGTCIQEMTIKPLQCLISTLQVSNCRPGQDLIPLLDSFEGTMCSCQFNASQQCLIDSAQFSWSFGSPKDDLTDNCTIAVVKYRSIGNIE